MKVTSFYNKSFHIKTDLSLNMRIYCFDIKIRIPTAGNTDHKSFADRKPHKHRSYVKTPSTNHANERFWSLHEFNV